MHMELLAGFLFAVCFVMSECKFPTYPSQAYKIRKFFDTTDPIWTVYTTGPTNRRCEVDIVQDMTKASVYFKRQFVLGEEKISRRILGTFNPNRKKHMEINIPGSNHTVAEDILYMSENQGCAVIMATFFDTTEAIWTVYTTGPTNRRCEVDEVQDVTKASVYFKRQFFLGEEKISRRILGSFNPNRKKHMDINIPGILVAITQRRRIFST
ncbi:uncharacterized protein LOC142589081 isoform X2 [Dermacentor variabilis]|uniref:uncharacterized protein LOC142589081 isoform X2 n=1 Tax=Dermacentor variabilis TaxID=34621 RepID=UPI003F5C6685